MMTLCDHLQYVALVSDGSCPYAFERCLHYVRLLIYKDKRTINVYNVEAVELCVIIKLRCVESLKQEH